MACRLAALCQLNSLHGVCMEIWTALYTYMLVAVKNAKRTAGETYVKS